MRAMTAFAIVSLLGLLAACGEVDPDFQGTIKLDQATSWTAVTGESY